MTENFQFGISKTFTCNYLPAEQERLLIAVDAKLHNATSYAWLMSLGFRRSGEQIYRPYCMHCEACQAIRVLVAKFQPSASQRKTNKKNSEYRVVYNNGSIDAYYPLYQRYINTIHSDGTMFPANFKQYQEFLTCTLVSQCFIEIWHQDKLLSVAITDLLPDALSAVYTFYDPDYRHKALGVFSILSQLELAKLLNKQYLYLGYQIDACQKMNYKDRYFPYQRFIHNQWKLITN
jgi:leucyl-tRNA---protein transferase